MPERDRWLSIPTRGRILLVVVVVVLVVVVVVVVVVVAGGGFCDVLVGRGEGVLVGCITSHQHACVSQGPICSDNFTYVLPH